jgi:hypothetical protein
MSDDGVKGAPVTRAEKQPLKDAAFEPVSVRNSLLPSSPTFPS